MCSAGPLQPAHLPERERLATLRRRQRERAEAIFRVEEEITALNASLAAFEAQLHTRLGAQEQRLARLEDLVRHVEQWIRLLETADSKSLVTRAERLERRRAQRVRRRAVSADTAGPGGEEAPPTQRSGAPDLDALKRVFRQLVRRHHPDLAESEEDRLRRVALLQQITDWYRAGDLARLESLAATAAPTEADVPAASLPEQIAQAEARLAWYETVLQNRLDERDALEHSDLYRLWRDAQDRAAAGEDPFASLAAELDARLTRRAQDLAWLYRRLEHAVKQHNKPSVSSHPAPHAEAGPLEPVFDPLASRPLVRWGLEAMRQHRATGPARQEADWVASLAEDDPPLLRLLLFAHVSELTRLPLPGLETYEELKLRYEVGLEPPAAEGLEHALARAADRVEFGVRRATPKLAFLGLRFRSDATREAVALALAAAPVRHAFRRVLEVLGEQSPCPGCGQDTFAVPLYRTRGLDELRAWVCPACGRLRHRYYLPKGDDLQSVLNPAYLDLGLVREWTFHLDRAWVALQLVPVEADRMTLGQLKARLVADLFERYAIGLGRGHLRLWQDGRRVAERTPLAELPDAHLEVRLRADAPMSLRDAVERLRHRIRSRFAPSRSPDSAP